MTHKEIIEENFNRLLVANKEPVVIAIKGEWGFGKTHFWNKYKNDRYIKEPYIDNAIKYAYVSLFGKTSIAEIKQDIVSQVKVYKKFIEVLEPSIKKIASLDNIYHLLKVKDFEKTIICFDDFERLSYKLKINDIIGLISELKDVKNCKVILLLNEDKIEETFKNDYNIAKEKIIDYEFEFELTYNEIFDILSLNTIFKDIRYKKYLEKYIKKYEIKNIRIIKKLIRVLNDLYSAIKDIEEKYIDLDKMINHSLYISTLYFLYGFKEFDKLKDYEISKLIDFNEEEIEKNEEYEKYLKYFGDIYFNNDIKNIILSYLETNIFDNELLQKYKDNFHMNKCKNDFNDLMDINSNLGISKNDFVSNVKSFLNENKDRLIRLGYSSNIISYFEKIFCTISPDDKEYFQGIITHSIIEHFKYLKSNNPKFLFLDNIQDTENYKLFEYCINYNDETKKEYEKIVKECIFFIEKKKDSLLKIGFTNTAYDIQLLNNLPISLLKYYITKDKELLRNIIASIKEKKLKEYCNNFYNNFIAIINEFNNSPRDSLQKYQMKSILKYLELSKLPFLHSFKVVDTSEGFGVLR